MEVLHVIGTRTAEEHDGYRLWRGPESGCMTMTIVTIHRRPMTTVYCMTRLCECPSPREIVPYVAPRGISHMGLRWAPTREPGTAYRANSHHVKIAPPQSTNATNNKREDSLFDISSYSYLNKGLRCRAAPCTNQRSRIISLPNRVLALVLWQPPM